MVVLVVMVVVSRSSRDVSVGGDHGPLVVVVLVLGDERCGGSNDVTMVMVVVC